MPVENIKITNLTVFEDIEIDFCSGINIIIGETGTGKTHLLKTLFSFCEYDCGISSLSGIPKWSKSFDMLLQACFQERNLWGLARNTENFKAGSITFIAHSFGTKYGNTIVQKGSYHNLQSEMTSKKQIPTVYIPAKEMLTHLEKDYDGNLLVEAGELEKLSLITRLIETGHLQKNSVLIWDEPEVNLNPELIPSLAEVLLKLSRSGVQIFLATQDYITLKYFEVKCNENDDILFHSLYKTNLCVKCESNVDFGNLKEKI